MLEQEKKILWTSVGDLKHRLIRLGTFIVTDPFLKDQVIVERLVGWLKEHRRIATRYEKLASSFVAVIKLALIRRHRRKLFQVA